MRQRPALFAKSAIIVLAVLLVTLAAVASRPNPLSAQAGDENPSLPLRVVIKPLDPFVMAEGDAYRGFSIDLWQEIAARLDRDYEYRWVETVTDQLAEVEEGAADLAITGISITEAREEVVDFSLPYFNAGLQIMTLAGHDSGWSLPVQVITALLSSPDFLRLLGVLALLTLATGLLWWLLELKSDPDYYHQSPLTGIWDGIWNTMITMLGYGDHIPRTFIGRLMTLAWMFLSIFLISAFTASIASRLTVNQIQGAIQGEQDLPGKRIATVANSTAAQYLEAHRLPYTSVEVIEDAYALLEDGKVDAVVYDSPVLLYYASSTGQGRVQVVDGIFQPQDYGIAFPTGSPERESVNRVLLSIAEDGTYDQIYRRWFGSLNTE